MNASFGIDHPLLATNDIETLRRHLISLGFNMTAIGKHPWGTSNSLAMFEGCLLEIMGIYDASLIDEVPAGDFRFGRHVYEHLQQREGVALTALHSTDSKKDAEQASRLGFHVEGHLEFGRHVKLPDGTTDQTKTTLALLPDYTFPRMSLFLCQQHRPELIYVPQWLEHSNTVNGICGVNMVADAQYHQILMDRFSGLYSNCQSIAGGFQCQTANGLLSILDAVSFEKTIAHLPKAMRGEKLPFVAGMDFSVSEPEILVKHLEQSGVDFHELANGYALALPELTANTTFRFFKTSSLLY